MTTARDALIAGRTRRFATLEGSKAGAPPSVLCVLDPSAGSSEYVALAADLGRRLGRRLVLVPLPEQTSQAGQLARVAAAADDERAELIVTPARLLADSTAGAPSGLGLPRLVSCPVVAVPGPGGHPPRVDGPVVCGIDASDDSAGAVRAAARLAVDLGTRVVLVHVAPVSESRSLRRVHTHAVFGNALGRVIPRLDRTPPVDLVLDAGEPARRLVSTAEEAGAAFIVIGAAASGRLASSVLASSDLPLMLVPNLNAEDAGPVALSGGRRLNRAPSGGGDLPDGAMPGRKCTSRTMVRRRG